MSEWLHRGLAGKGLKAVFRLYLFSLIVLAPVSILVILIFSADQAFRLIPLLVALLVCGQYFVARYAKNRKPLTRTYAITLFIISVWVRSLLTKISNWLNGQRGVLALAMIAITIFGCFLLFVRTSSVRYGQIDVVHKESLAPKRATKSGDDSRYSVDELQKRATESAQPAPKKSSPVPADNSRDVLLGRVPNQNSSIRSAPSRDSAARNHRPSEPTEEQMKEALLSALEKRGGQRATDSSVEIDNSVVSVTFKIEKFEKHGCKLAANGVGYECTYIINTSTSFHSNDGTQRGNQQMEALNSLQGWLGGNTVNEKVTRRFVWSKEGWILSNE